MTHPEDAPSVDGDYLASLIDHWVTSYDWRDHERQIRSLPWILTGVDTDVPIRTIHQRAPGAESRRGAPAARMAELGYERYVVSAGDVGSDVADVLTARYGDRVAALHLADVSQYRYLVDPPTDVSEAERAYMEHGHRWQDAEGGDMHLQRTKPHTVAVALGDSPAGLAAWILTAPATPSTNFADVSRRSCHLPAS